MLKSKYEILLLIIEKQSFSAASQEIGYTPSGLNRLVDSLENDLGIRIFYRTKKGLTLTEEGRAALPYIQKISYWENQLRSCTEALNGLASGTLNIGTIYCISNHILPEIIKSFTEEYPGIEVNILQGSHQELDKWLEEGKVDLIFTTRRSSDENWISIKKDPIVVWISKNHPLAEAKAFPQKQLEKEAYIQTFPGQNTDSEYLIQQRNIKVNVKYSSQDNYTTYKMVESGLGVSLNNLMMSKNWKDEVVSIPLEPAAFVELGIRCPTKELIPVTARKFIELCSKIN